MMEWARTYQLCRVARRADLADDGRDSRLKHADRFVALRVRSAVNKHEHGGAQYRGRAQEKCRILCAGSYGRQNISRRARAAFRAPSVMEDAAEATSC